MRQLNKGTVIVLPGQIIQIFEGKPETCRIYLENQITPFKVSIRPGIQIEHDFVLEFSVNDTTYDLFQNWLAASPVESVAQVLIDFGLFEFSDVLVSELSDTEVYQLKVFQAILKGAEVIELISPWILHEASAFLLAVQKFAEKQAVYHGGPIPAWVIYDGDIVPGLTLIADRILSIAPHGEIGMALAL